MATEALAVLLIVHEAAETVTSVVEAVHALSDLLGGFKPQKDHTPELMKCIELAKKEVIEEIQKSELNTNLNSLYACADDWNITQDKLVDLALKEKAGEDPNKIDGMLRVYHTSILDTIKRLNEIKYYFRGPRPKPRSPEMLGVYFLCYSLHHSFTFAAEAIYAKMFGTISPNFATGIDNLRDSSSNMTDAISEYKNFRQGQIYYREIIEHEGGPPLHTGQYKIITDVGGDSAIGNLAGNMYTPNPGKYAIGEEVIEDFWNSSKFGSGTRTVFKGWVELEIKAMTTARSLYLRANK
ncbi:hypothetical protein N7540_013173 [Penicillium herquei]|nr:hypothetical protein N7540_013173 [Penicillium herquei]